MENLKASKYLSTFSLQDKWQKFSEFFFKVNSDTEISLRFKNEKFYDVGIHITDFSTKSTEIEIQDFDSFKKLFKLLSGDEFDIDKI